jgi:hypothetical protein
MHKLNFVLLVASVLCSINETTAQNFHLSQQNQIRLNAASSAKERLRMYHRFYKRDSARFNRTLRKRFRQSVDSAANAYRHNTRTQARRWSNEKYTRISESLTKIDSMTDIKINDRLRDSTGLDSIAMAMREKLASDLRKKGVHIGNVPGRKNIFPFLNIEDDLPEMSIDTLTGIALPEMVSRDEIAEYLKKNKWKGGIEQIEGRKSIFGTPEPGRTPDKNDLATEAKEIVKEKSFDLMTTHSESVLNSLGNVSRLLSRYRRFNDSTDPSTAVRRTSLKGRSFREHLLLSCGLSLKSIELFQFDLHPQFGYKFNARFAVGGGLGYRLTFGDTLTEGPGFSAKACSWKLFSTFSLKKAFFAHAEIDAVQRPYGQESNRSRWTFNYYIGLGRRFLVHPKIYFNITALYHLQASEQNAFHPDRFRVRAGIELSELAMLTKRIIYHPNS